jgi:hypothetical protein
VKDIYDILEEVKEDPKQYLGRTSVVALKGFINGYILAKSEMDIPLTDRENDFLKFQKWMNHRFSCYCIKETDWDKIVILLSNDESEALDSFFYHLEAFKIRKEK